MEEIKELSRKLERTTKDMDFLSRYGWVSLIVGAILVAISKSFDNWFFTIIGVIGGILMAIFFIFVLILRNILVFIHNGYLGRYNRIIFQKKQHQAHKP